jgi:hypothetical protein
MGKRGIAEMIDRRENLSNGGGGKTCPIAILSTTNPTWSVTGSIPRLSGDKNATNRITRGFSASRNPFAVTFA